MIEILIAFFAVMGIGLLGSVIMDALYFRNRQYDLPLIIDLRSSGLEDAWSKMESVALARKSPGGRAILCDLIVLVSLSNDAVTEGMANHYLRVFDLPGTVFTEEEAWYAPYQKTPEKDGMNPS